MQQDEIARTGIASLKVRFNSVFGYYIEVTKSNLDKVPPQYIRKQTVAGGERFITPELKEMEGKILGAEERVMKLEYELFQRVREVGAGAIAALAANGGGAGAIGRAGVVRRDGAALQLLPAGNSARRASCKSGRAGIRCWNKASRGNGLCRTTSRWTEFRSS